MASSISEDASEILGTIRRTEASNPAGAPQTTFTQATDQAPRGHITDDSFRGAIFWEAEVTDDEQEDEMGSAGEAEVEDATWGKPFKVEWISTRRVPFGRTRGLRNAWNGNREVKIARDGTELEPVVGIRLLQLFDRPGPPWARQSGRISYN
jgi:hypothetical protein